MTPNQVLIQEENLEFIVLKKIKGYTKPVKTKHLANKLDIPRPVLVQVLNKLHQQNLISWHIPKRDNNKRYYGWIKNQN